MINLRYHIVSITAVFLALGLGVAVGTTFLDRATVDTLNNRLDGLQRRIDNTEAENGELSDRVNSLEDLEEQLADQGDRLLAGALDAVPVVVVATRGVDQDIVTGVVDALAASGAQLSATVWLTDKLALDDEGARTDLAGILGLPDRDPAQLRRAVSTRLANDFAERAQIAVAPAGGQSVPEVPDAVDPELLVALRTAGFVDIDPAPGAADDAPVLPAAGARYIVISGPGAELPDLDIVIPFLARLTDRNPVSVVAAQAGTGDTGDDSQTVFVALVRDDEALRQRVSTVDDLEAFAGRAAAVLALQDAGTGRIGHYGVGDGADALLPATVEGG